MNSILDSDDGREVDGHTGTDLPAYAGGRVSRGSAETGDHEITLGTLTILAIFFGLAVVCAGFFGFGYSVGAKRVIAQNSALSAGLPGISSSANLPACKPAPGSPAVVARSAETPGAPAPAAAAATPTPKVVTTAASETPLDGREHTPIRSVATSAALSTATPSSIAGPGTMVQVAAVSHQEDAQLLVNTLKQKGYNVAIHSSATDALLHIQVGPFATRKDAEAMKERLSADGFNAILK